MRNQVVDHDGQGSRLLFPCAVCVQLGVERMKRGVKCGEMAGFEGKKWTI
jgi:hypothetical protein